MTELLENPWPAILVGGLLAIALLVLAFKSGRGLWIIVMGLVLVVTAGLVVLERVVVTERERVEQAIYDTAAAVDSNDVNAVLDYVSPAAGGTRNRIRAELPAYRIGDVSLSDLTIEVVGDPAATATADFVGRCWVEERHGAGGGRLTYVSRFLVRLQKENGRWLLTSYEQRPVLGK